MLPVILISSCLLCVLAYRFYGKFLTERCQLNDERATPAVEKEDGVDFAPARASVLFGHHFSSIAGAGPIVGPILAATYFGWGPTWVWILVGAILVGGVHDFGSTLMSVRNGGRSIADTMRGLVGEGAGKLFMLFVVLALVYVIIVFLDLTANTFAKQPSVATASGWFIVVAIIFGVLMRSGKFSLSQLALIFFPLTFAGLAVGHLFPMIELGKEVWIWLTLGYCFVAAVLPVGLLLQPRDFLSAGFLYAILVVGALGMSFAGETIQMPAFTGWESEKLGMLVPFLFITVACGACSGFHSIVSSGTTSKQIKKESDVRRISYGGMLVEGVLAVFAMGCVAVLTVGEREAGGTPVGIFAAGAAKFFGAVGIPTHLGAEFAMLAISTFLLTTLDTCTRLTRFLIEELFVWRNEASRYLGTLLALGLPTILVFQQFPGTDGTLQPAWKAIWPLFGATNQLLAALALLTFVVFLKASRVKYGFALLPAVVMILMPMTALVQMANSFGLSTLLGGTAAGMFILGLFLMVTSWRSLTQSQNEPLTESTL
ncbi:MAG: carbon starvation CstA family protein [Verrucomicrobiota bacterium]|nr:carbon starvation CstA family protein [Verrucomicrobiota bacterium]